MKNAVFLILFAILGKGVTFAQCGTSDTLPIPDSSLVYFDNIDSVQGFVDSLNLDSIANVLSPQRLLKAGSFFGGPNGSAINIPIKFWIVKDASDNYSINIWKHCNEVIYKLNHDYSLKAFEGGLSFYKLEIGYIDDQDHLFDISAVESNTAIPAFSSSGYLPGVINVYVVNTITGATGFAHYPGDNGSNDYCVVAMASKLQTNIIIHEIGHTLNLIHTHGVSNTNPNHTKAKCEQEAAVMDETVPNTCNNGNDGSITGVPYGDHLTDTYGSPKLDELEGTDNWTNRKFDVDGDGNPDGTGDLFFDKWGNPWNQQVWYNMMGYGASAKEFSKMQRDVMTFQIITGKYGSNGSLITDHLLNIDNVNFDQFEPNEALDGDSYHSSIGAYNMQNNTKEREYLEENGFVQMHCTFHVGQQNSRDDINNETFDIDDEDWFHYQPYTSTTGAVRIYTTPAPGFTDANTKIEIYYLNSGSLTLITQNDDDATNYVPSGYSLVELTGGFTGNTKYYIRVTNMGSSNNTISGVPHYILNIQTCNDEIPWDHAPPADAIYNITGASETISGPLAINGQIIVQDGAQLTLSNKIEFVDIGEPSIIVEPGGKLILSSNVTLTSLESCETQATWGGILVKGDPYSKQSPTSNQGYLVSSGATITNARIAIDVGEVVVNNVNPSIVSIDGGGIIVASNTTFLNNEKDLRFHAYYQKHLGGQPIKNLSNFSNCTFKTDAQFFGVASKLNEHVELRGVQGVTFKGCSFLDTRTIAITSRSSGILTLGATVFITSGTTTLGGAHSADRTQFTGLKTGCTLIGKGLLSQSAFAPSVIRYCEFDCYTGIKASDASIADIYENTFDSKFYGTTSGGYFNYNMSIGASLDNCNAYFMDENTFSSEYNGSNQSYTSIALGLVVRDNKDRLNVVNMNTFENHAFSTEAIGWNRRDDSRTQGPPNGLQYKCNEFNNNASDILFLDDLINPHSGGQNGIGLAPQGSVLQPAGNLFGQAYTPGSEWHIHGYDANRFEYRHHDILSNARVKPLEINDYSVGYPYALTRVTGLLWSSSYCQSRVNTSSGISQADYDGVDDISGLWKVKRAHKKNLTDGGSTGGRITDIETSTVGTAQTVTDNLLSFSPYLSNEVLEFLATKEGSFTHEMIKDIMLANPHSGRNDNLENILIARNDAFPQAYIDSIDSIGQYYSEFDTLLDSLYYYELSYRDYLYDFLHRALTVDSADIFYEFIEPTYLNSNDPYLYYDLVDLYDQRGLRDSANDLLDSIPIKFDLSPIQESYHNSFTNLRTLLFRWDTSGVNFYSLDSLQLDTLSGYYDSTDGIQDRVLALLYLNGVETFNPVAIIVDPDSVAPPPQLELRGFGREIFDPTSEYKVVGNSLETLVSIRPNPARSSVDVVHPKSISRIYLYSNLGKLLEAKTVQNIEITNFEVTNYVDGQYFVVLFDDKNKTVTTKPLLIIH